jgi:hypothetical protein
MDTADDIRAQLAGDMHLQTEINHALLAVADALPAGADRRVVRILTRTLQESWAVHVDFQNEVVFPILEGRHGPKVVEMIEQGRSEHAELTQQHGVIAQQLENILNDRAGDRMALDTALRITHAQRQSHFGLDAALADWLPKALTQLERSLCADWSSAHPHLRFPLNLLRSTGRLLPRLGGRVH